MVAVDCCNFPFLFQGGKLKMQEQELEYAGFWIRTLASIIDTILLLCISVPLLLTIYGWDYLEGNHFIAGPADFLISWVLPFIAVLLFWMTKQATPGKMAVSTRILDAASGNPPTTGQWIGRYFGYFIATLPLGLGILWVAFDRRKQGWHDKLAGTVVVRRRGPEPVMFNSEG
jgi:uncharacterized RDD family membrane protein YckC